MCVPVLPEWRLEKSMFQKLFRRVTQELHRFFVGLNYFSSRLTRMMASPALSIRARYFSSERRSAFNASFSDVMSGKLPGRASFPKINNARCHMQRNPHTILLCHIDKRERGADPTSISSLNSSFTLLARTGRSKSQKFVPMDSAFS